ncbi:MAG TPA: cytochrome P460 family protein [Methylococcaceae bacterium]|nr:cytochrome P460 family protein [Methylococcaceae bacterium]
MNSFLPKTLLLLVLPLLSTASVAEAPPAPNGITLPPYFKEWRLIGLSHRTDKNSLRAILGNPKAIEAARAGQTNPWPDGAVLAKIVWQDATLPEWESATVPGNLQHVEFMVKDRLRYADTGGWGFARWLGEELKPYGNDANFANECFTCHGAASSRDHVFTHPVKIP